MNIVFKVMVLNVLFLLQAIGNGSIAQARLTNGEKGNFFSINWGWALGVMLGILASGSISGINYEILL